jgi:hypothetical protein
LNPSPRSRGIQTTEGLLCAAWRHLDARDGFEAVFVRGTEDGWLCEGEVAAAEDGVAWAVRYRIVVDRSWTTRSAEVAGLSPAGRCERSLRTDGQGGWRVDGESAPELAACFDVDLEASVFTNALLIARLQLGIGDAAAAPAAYVRVPDLRVERRELARAAPRPERRTGVTTTRPRRSAFAPCCGTTGPGS